MVSCIVSETKNIPILDFLFLAFAYVHHPIILPS
jgi:hypothetical protein